MDKLKRILFFVIVLAILISLPGCGSDTPAGDSEQGATFPLVDCIGREVEVPENVEKIAALYSFAGYAVGLLGRGNDLVGVPDGLQRDKLLIEIFPEVARASVPRKGGAINAEELMRIKPDLVIVRKYFN